MRVYSLLLTFGRPSSNAPDLRRLPFGLYAKLGSAGILQEAETLQFVAEYTSIPVPVVLDAFEDPVAGPFLLTSRVPGTPLSRMPCTIDTLTPEHITVIADTLRDWLNQLQYLRSPYGRALCGYLGGVFMSYRIHTKDVIGPYRSQEPFHEQEACLLTEVHDEHVRALAAIIRQKTYDVCMVHGNVAPENVLVDRHYRPVGMVGWECAAWMPSYWELTAGAWTARGLGGVWSHILVRCLPQYTDELKVEQELWKTYTPY